MSSILELVCVGIVFLSFLFEVFYLSGWEYVKLFFFFGCVRGFVYKEGWG